MSKFIPNYQLFLPLPPPIQQMKQGNVIQAIGSFQPNSQFFPSYISFPPTMFSQQFVPTAPFSYNNKYFNYKEAPVQVEKQTNDDEEDGAVNDEELDDVSEQDIPENKQPTNKEQSFRRVKNSFLNKPTNKPLVYRGNNRLQIRFEHFGVIGPTPQTCGHTNLIIPDGLVCYSTVYHQPWRFETHHISKDSYVAIQWVVVNLVSNLRHEVIETRKEAERRCCRGWTISSKVFKTIMEDRATELERYLTEESNEVKSKNVYSIIKALRPKLFSDGLLVFGLQHQVVQEEMLKQVESL